VVIGAIVLDETFEWNGASVRWGRFGDGPAVVTCHGTPWSSFVWRSVIDALQHDRCMYVWDMIGYGQSDKPDCDVSLAAQGELFAALVDHWRIDPPAVIAHDYGGAVALRGHLLHDVGVESFALIDIVALRPWGSPFFRLVADNAGVFAALPANLHEALLREYVSGASATGLLPDVMTRSSPRGWGRVKRRSTGRSPKLMSASPTKSSRVTVTLMSPP
jgi:pimeloyl-ACP methyl ester carboxylesterase